MDHYVTIRKIESLTHNVRRILTDKPKDYSFTPGQATEVAIDLKGYREEKRPFTFTSLVEDKELEFTIKIYPSHDGVTDKLDSLKIGDKLIIGDAWGAISYQGEGDFIAGGAGITPFLAIFKDLHRKGQLQGNRLFFANKTEKDIIHQGNLQTWLNSDFHNILSEEDHEAYDHGHINKEYLQSHDLDVSKKVYLCGPPPMMDALQADLYAMGLSKKQLVAEGLG